MFYTERELKKIGFKAIGDNVLISDKASIYGAENIEIGSNVRIDDFVILSAGDGGIKLGSYIHIACFAQLIGHASITLDDFAQVSGKCSIYSSSDDFSGTYLVGPTIPMEFLNVKHLSVHLKSHTLLGCNTVIMPGVTIGENTCTGAMSLVLKDLKPNSVYVGAPAKLIADRFQLNRAAKEWTLNR